MKNPINQTLIFTAVFTIVGAIAYEKTVGPKVRNMLGGA